MADEGPTVGCLRLRRYGGLVNDVNSTLQGRFPESRKRRWIGNGATLAVRPRRR